MNRLKVIFLSLGLALSQVSAAKSSPVHMLEQSADQILSVLKENKSTLKSNPNIVYKAVETYFVPHVDVMGMSRTVLGRNAWQKASEAERSEFSRVFTQLVIRTYARPLAKYTDESVQFLPIRGALSGRFVRINSVIVRTEGQNIPLSYSLVLINNQWKVYDISVEGVSLLQSFRSQFAQVLQNSDIKEVIRQMHEKKNAKVAA